VHISKEHVAPRFCSSEGEGLPVAPCQEFLHRLRHGSPVMTTFVTRDVQATEGIKAVRSRFPLPSLMSGSTVPMLVLPTAACNEQAKPHGMHAATALSQDLEALDAEAVLPATVSPGGRARGPGA
jgi:hypothetical protein